MIKLIPERNHKLITKGIVAKGNCCGKNHQLSRNKHNTAKLVK